MSEFGVLDVRGSREVLPSCDVRVHVRTSRPGVFETVYFTIDNIAQKSCKRTNF